MNPAKRKKLYRLELREKNKKQELPIVEEKKVEEKKVEEAVEEANVTPELSSVKKKKVVNEAV
jgi:hypothetical protein